MTDPTARPSAAVSSPPPDQTGLRDRIAAKKAEPAFQELGKLLQTPVAIDVVAGIVLHEAAEIAEKVAESLRQHHEFERSTGALDVMTELRRLAAEAQPEAPWATDGARIGRALIWSWARVGDTDFGRGYRTAQEDVRAILTRPLLGAGAQQQPDTETQTDDVALLRLTLDAVEEGRRELRAENSRLRSQLWTLAAVFEGFGHLLATSSRDWGQYAPDAWLWAVICGWDCEEPVHDETCVHGAMEEMAERHGWDAATVAKARRYRAVVHTLTAPAVPVQPAAAGTREEGGA